MLAQLTGIAEGGTAYEWDEVQPVHGGRFPLKPHGLSSRTRRALAFELNGEPVRVGAIVNLSDCGGWFSFQAPSDT